MKTKDPVLLAEIKDLAARIDALAAKLSTPACPMMASDVMGRALRRGVEELEKELSAVPKAVTAHTQSGCASFDDEMDLTHVKTRGIR
ncbi:MAG TPA: hypothetical protein VK550_13500 [Polyangiaceae bacterium]|nr:hypothetical protein [Polyangiaceae bacterium]